MIKNVLFQIGFLLLVCGVLHGQYGDTTKLNAKPIGSVLRTVRDMDMTNDSIPEVMQIETSKAKHIKDIKIRFAIYRGKKILYQKFWKANDYFDPKDHVSDAIKWFRLQRIMRVFFSDQNFSMSGDEAMTDMFKRVRAVDIKPGSNEAKEFAASGHKIFSLYGGRDMLLGITWLASENKFVTIWRN